MHSEQAGSTPSNQSIHYYYRTSKPQFRFIDSTTVDNQLGLIESPGINFTLEKSPNRDFILSSNSRSGVLSINSQSRHTSSIPTQASTSPTQLQTESAHSNSPLMFADNYQGSPDGGIDFVDDESPGESGSLQRSSSLSSLLSFDEETSSLGRLGSERSIEDTDLIRKRGKIKGKRKYSTPKNLAARFGDEDEIYDCLKEAVVTRRKLPYHNPRTISSIGNTQHTLASLWMIIDREYQQVLRVRDTHYRFSQAFCSESR